MSHADILELAGIVGGVAARFGLHSNPRLAELQRTSEESKEYETRIVADYIAEANGRTHGRIIVTVGVYKDTGRATVLIRDLDSFSTSEFTSALEKEITAALGVQKISWDVKVERGTVGPDLGP